MNTSTTSTAVARTVRHAVRPIRFTDHVEAMASFLAVLGLARQEESEHGGWVVMRAGRGAVALHDAATSDLGAEPGETQLCFVSTDLDALAADLGLTPYDEAWGRALVVPAPAGLELHVDGADEGDGYGYRRLDDVPEAGWTVRPVWFLPLDLRPEARRLLATFDLQVRPGGDEWWEACEGPGGGVGLHHPVDDSPTCGLGFETSEALSEVVERLRAAGHEAETCHADGVGDLIRLTDPDGRTWEIHPSPGGVPLEQTGTA